MKRYLPLPPDLAEINPHAPGSLEYVAWSQARAGLLQRPVVVVSSYPNGSTLGWVSTDGALGSLTMWLKRPGAYWFYLDEIGDEPASTTDSKLIAEIDRLRGELDAANDRLAKIAELATGE